MKKYIKIFTFALFSFFMFSVSVFAREMDINELGEEASKIEKDAGYVYILGEYAFTSKYKITLDDIIIASSSLNLKDPTDLSQALIYQIERERDDNYVATGWKLGENVLGKAKMPDKVDVKLIDMHRVLEKSEATINIDINGKDNYSTYTQILKDKLKFEFAKAYGNGKLTYSDGKVTGILLKNTKITLSEEDQTKFNNPIYFFAYVLEIPNATSETKVTTAGLGRKGELKWTSFDVTTSADGKKPGIVVLVPVDAKGLEEDPSYTITVDLDGDKGEKDNIYDKTEYKLDLTGLKLQQESKMEIKTDNLPTADVESILDKYGYARSEADTYKLESKEGEVNKYKLTGVIAEQVINESAFPSDERTGFYFLLSVGQNINKDLYQKATVTFPGNKSTKTSTITDETGVTILFSITKEIEGKTIKITVDLDGDGNEYYPVDYEIDLSELTLEKSSKFSIESVDKEGLSENPLIKDFGWKKETGFETNFNTEITTDGIIVKVTGLIPILEEFDNGKNPFEGDEATGYYLPFVIKTLDKTTNGSNKVTVQFIHEGENPKTLTATNFDGSDVLYILRHLDKNAIDKTFKIIVDMDGDGKEYAPYEVTFDWSELKLQEKTVPSVSLTGVSKKDEEQLASYGYQSSYNENLELKPVDGSNNSVQLKGILKEQIVGPNVFGNDNTSGYYFTFTFQLPDGVTPKEAKIARLNSSDLNGGSNVKKEFKESEYDSETNTLTILYQFPKDVDCKGKECKIYYSVDYDGAGNEYLPTLYTIDYSQATFKKSSLVKLEPVDNTTIGESEEWNGFTEGKDYSVKFTEDASTFKVTGLIAIFNDEEWDKEGNPFKGAYDYYLAFKLSKAEVKGSDSTTIVKFLTDGEGHGDKNKITGEDFGENNSIYVLKYLNPNKEYDNKEFTITIDFDGENGEAYEPYTITIDWSELDFQYETHVAKPALVNPSATSSDTDRGYISEQNKTDIKSYGYDFDNVGDIKIENEGEEGYKLTGTVKEQNVPKAGFKEATGYYVPIKIYGPSISDAYGDHFLSQPDGCKKWTIYLRDEDGEYRQEITPSEEDYKNGYIVVLFKLKKDDSDHKITYKIDWDGSKSNVFLEKEVKISYDSDFNYQALNTITYNYKDAEGNNQTATAQVYQNEEATLKDIKGINTDYRKFDGWYKSSDNSKVEGETLTIKEDKDETLTAHWTLDADAFIKAVINDLNDDDTTHSAKFNDKFILEQEENNITVDIKQPNVLLSELSKTSIPGAMAYVLEKGEISDITLTVGDSNTKKFTKDADETLDTLKQEIITEAKKLFDTELSKNEATATLDKVEFIDKDDKIFTIEIGDTVDDTVTLVKSDGTEVTNKEDKTYTFKFDSDFVVVDQDGTIGAKDIKEALSDNKDYSTVYIDGKYEAESTIDITASNDVTIAPVESASSINLLSAEDKTISTKTGDYVIDVKAGNGTVTISNLELTGGEKAELKVENGATVKVDNVKLSKNGEEDIEEGIYVDATGTLNVTNITFEDETHDVPAVRGKNDKKGNQKAEVTFKSSTIQEGPYYNIEIHDKLWCKDEGKGAEELEYCKTSIYDDYYEYTTDTFYYSNSKNKKDYILVGFMNNYKFHGGMYKIVENGTTGQLKPSELSSEDKTGKNTNLHFVGWGRYNTSSSNMKYTDIITDWSNINVTNQSEGNKFYFAYYVEYKNKITVNTNGLDTDGINKYNNQEYHTYKLADKENGMTVGELRKIDPEFDQMLKDLDANKGPINKIMIGDQEVSDETLISSNVTLTLSTNSEMG